MKILLASPEVVPYAKTGGLADVAGALPLALEELGHDIRVIMPRYKKVNDFKLETVVNSFDIPISNRVEPACIKKHTLGKNIPVYFLENNRYYDREELYGTSSGDYEDNAERFIYFARGIIEACKKLNFQPDVIHCNDWQTGLVPVYLKTLYRDDPFFRNTSTVFTYHNIGYQGNFWHLDMYITGLGWDVFTPEGIEFYGDISMLKAGMVYADIINTVSPTYSKETQIKEYGHRLEGVLSLYEKKLYGILNGIDYKQWAPAIDEEITTPYSSSDLKGKEENKAALQQFFGLPARKDVPLLGIVSRLAGQKGFDILADVMQKLMRMDLQMVILGTGEEKYHKLLRTLQGEHKDRLGVMIAFDNKIARMIYAGSDMFLMPSKYEPCGIGQLISFRYGTVPVVRKTGGLADTVKNYTPKKGGNGFVFSEYTGKHLLSVIKKALKVYGNKREWNALVRLIMTLDFSWTSSAKEYEKIYKMSQKRHKAELKGKKANVA